MDSGLQRCIIFGPKMSQQEFFQKNYNFDLPRGPFHYSKFSEKFSKKKKKDQNGSLAQMKNFFEKCSSIFLLYLLQNMKGHY